jgi:hypothetical protein
VSPRRSGHQRSALSQVHFLFVDPAAEADNKAKLENKRSFTTNWTRVALVL